MLGSFVKARSLRRVVFIWSVAFFVSSWVFATPSLAEQQGASQPGVSVASAGAGADEAGGDHGAHGPGKFNLYYGILGEKEGVEPSFLWRSPGMPVPFVANLVNFFVFLSIIVGFGRKPLQEALKKRKKTIMADIDEAAKMKQQASERLRDYEDKLGHIDDEVERIKKDFAAQGQREKQRIIDDADEKEQRMLQDARFMIDQERKHMRNVLMRQTVHAAIAQAEKVLMQQVTSADHERIAEQYIEQLATAGLTISGTKGGAKSLPKAGQA